MNSVGPTDGLNVDRTTGRILRGVHLAQLREEVRALKRELDFRVWIPSVGLDPLPITQVFLPKTLHKENMSLDRENPPICQDEPPPTRLVAEELFRGEVGDASKETQGLMREACLALCLHR